VSSRSIAHPRRRDHSNGVVTPNRGSARGRRISIQHDGGAFTTGANRRSARDQVPEARESEGVVSLTGLDRSKTTFTAGRTPEAARQSRPRQVFRLTTTPQSPERCANLDGAAAEISVLRTIGSRRRSALHQKAKQGEHGQVPSRATAARITYTPGESFTGTDEFSYTMPMGQDGRPQRWSRSVSPRAAASVCGAG
jgi:hypothetical protein